MALICRANLFHYNYRMNADIASEALLGQAIWNSKQWVPDMWYPSTEVRLIGTANLSALFYGLCGSLKLAMGLACVVFVLWIILEIAYLFKEAEGVKRYCPFLILLMLALPADYSLLEVLYLFAGYYAVHTAALFFTLGVYGGSLRRKKFKAGVWFLSVCLAFLLGMQGARGLLVIYGPLLAVEVIRCGAVLWAGKRLKQADWMVSIWVLMNCLSNFWGSRLPISAGVGFSRNIRKGLYKLWKVVVPDIVGIMGGHSSGVPGRICLGILLINAVVILFAILYKIWKKRELEAMEWIYLVVCASPVMTALMVAFTTVESTGRYYFVFLAVLSLAAVMLLARQEKNLMPVKVICWAAAGFLMVGNLFHLYVPMMKSKEPPENDYKAVVDFLKENDYLLAYASFENANTMTLVSDGEVRVAPAASVEKMDICKWLSSKEWYPPEISRDQVTAYVVTESQMPEFSIFLQDKEDEIKRIWQTGKFHIYVSDYNYANIED